MKKTKLTEIVKLYLKEASSVDTMYALKNIKSWNRGQYNTIDDLSKDIIKDLGYKLNANIIKKVSEHLGNSADDDNKIPEDKALIKEIYSLLEKMIKELYSLKEENKEGSIKLKKGTSDSEIKKYTSKGIDVELNEGNSEFDGSGLIVYPNSPEDHEKLQEFVDNSDYYGIYNDIEDYWFFPEDESTIHHLESDLEEEFFRRDIDARFESQDEVINEYQDMKLSKVLKLLKDGPWETDVDIVPNKHAILKNRLTGKTKTINVRPDSLNEEYTFITFSIDDEKLDDLLHKQFSKALDYFQEDGDEFYTLPQREFDRFIDAADSRGFDVDYEDSEESVLHLHELKNPLKENNHIDIKDQLLDANIGDMAYGGGYGPFKKVARNTWKNLKAGSLQHSEKLASFIGGFNDFKIESSNTIKETKRQIHPVQMQQMMKHAKKEKQNTEETKEKMKKNDLKEVIKKVLKETNSLKENHLEQAIKMHKDEGMDYDTIHRWLENQGLPYNEIESIMNKIEDLSFDNHLVVNENQKNQFKFLGTINDLEKQIGKDKYIISQSPNNEKNEYDILDLYDGSWIGNFYFDGKTVTLIDVPNNIFYENISEQEDEEEIEDTWDKPEKDDSPSDADLDRQALKHAKAAKGKGKKLDLVLKELDSLKKEMIQLAKQWKESEEPEKSKLMSKLKQKQVLRNELEAEKEKLASKLIKEYTHQSFEAPDVIIDNKFLKLFTKLMPKTSRTIKSAESRIKSFEGGNMFVHSQYFEVQPNGNTPNRPLYRIHQNQYWLSEGNLKMMGKDPNEKVRVTFIKIYDITPNQEQKMLGQMFVNTDVFLDEAQIVFDIKKRVS